MYLSALKIRYKWYAELKVLNLMVRMVRNIIMECIALLPRACLGDGERKRF